jgi:ribosomal protein L7/L12
MPTDDANLDAELQALVAAGRKIEAIKRYRELTSAGLKEAKDAVGRGTS